MKSQLEWHMEKRFSPRKEIDSSVLIFNDQVGSIKALVKNISAQGMLVDTGRPTLPEGAIVELAGPASWKLESKTGLPKALIVHSKDGKAGLMVTANRQEAVDLSQGTSTIRLKKQGSL